MAPRFLPNTLISVDFAANYLTKIYGLTFGQKPNLRSEVRGGSWAQAGEVGGAEAEAATLSEAGEDPDKLWRRAMPCSVGMMPMLRAMVKDAQGLQGHRL